MSFDQRTPQDIFDRDTSGRRRPSQIQEADDIEARLVAPATLPVDAEKGTSGKKKLLIAVAVAGALLVGAVALSPDKRQAAAPQVASPGSGTTPPVVVLRTTTTQAIASTTDPQFSVALETFLKKFGSKKTTMPKLASALEAKFHVPVGVNKVPKPSPGGALKLSQIGTAEILVQVEDASSTVIGFHALTLH